MRRVDLVVMNGRSASSHVERLVDDVRGAITCDLVDRALDSGAFDSIIVSTNDPELAESLARPPLVTIAMDPQNEEFHFGKRLQSIIAEHRIERLVYFGGGSAPLISTDTLRSLAEQARSAERLLVANNFYSVDFCALAPASALLAMKPPKNDNGLGWLLSEKAGFSARELPRTVESSFDVDTPTDLLVLSLHPSAPRCTRRCLDDLSLNTRHAEAASEVFLDRQAEVLVSGRISAATISYLERETVCRSRVYSEERGMRADGRLARGEARSLLGMHMARVGVQAFFEDVIPQLGQAAFLDDRVLWADRGSWPSAADRFNSDLLRPEEIHDPFIQRFTSAAMSCPVPVVLGGHSLVSGGLRVLIDAAWASSSADIGRPLTGMGASR
jgi:CTP:molybdopterin cytidylyltransferase MocA